jgi:multiple sugar transport system permease protein
MARISAQAARRLPGAVPAAARRRRLLAPLGLGALAALWLVPLLAAGVTALRTTDDLTLHGLWALPREPAWGNFATAWTAGRIGRYLLNSLIVTVPSVAGMLALSSLSAYALARFRFRGNALIYAVYAGGTMLPYQVLMLPIFRLTSALGLNDSYAALIIVHTAFQLGFGTFVLRNFMRSVPQELVDAARVDGAGEFRIYGQIILPLILPALAAVATLEFMWIFNDYLGSIVLLRSDAMRPVTAGLATLRGEYNTDWPVIIAGALLAVVPPLAVFVALQRFFVRGLLFGARG